MHHYMLGLTDLKAVLLRRTWQSWWTLMWPEASSVSLWQGRPAASLAALRALPEVEEDLSLAIVSVSKGGPVKIIRDSKHLAYGERLKGESV